VKTIPHASSIDEACVLSDIVKRRSFRAYAREQSRVAAHVMSVVPDRSAVETILKQAGLSESVSVQHERKVRKEPTPSGVGIDDESD
jgi:hypothetical protein